MITTLETIAKTIQRVFKKYALITVFSVLAGSFGFGYRVSNIMSEIRGDANENKQLIVTNAQQNRQLIKDNYADLNKKIDSIALVQKLSNKSTDENFLDVRMDISKVLEVMVNQNKSYGLK